MARRIVASGPERQINQAPGQNNSQFTSDVATLTDGRYLVVFVDQFFGADFDIGGQFVNADGTLSGPTMVFGGTLTAIEGDGGSQSDPAVAQRPGGAAVVVWRDTNVGTGDIQLAIVNSAGVNITAGTELNVITGTTGAADQQSQPAVATLSDGRSLIVWTHAPPADLNVHARVLDAAGTGFTTADRLIVDDGAGFQSDSAVAASGPNAMVVYEDANDISARIFNGATETFGAEFVIANHTNSVGNPDIAALPDNRFVIVYGEDAGVFGRIYDPETPDSAFLSDEFLINQVTSLSASDPRVTATVDGGFIVVWQQDVGGANGVDVHQRRYDAHGLAYGDVFVVNTLTDNGQVSPVAATSGANVFTVWTDSGSVGREDTAPNGIRGQAATATAFDYDSARFGDFDSDGRDDILFQNDTGDLTIWRTNSAGVLSSITDIGSLPAGFRIDGTGNFNSTAGDDILLRSPTQVAVLPMNGFAAQPMQVLGNTSPDFLNSGMGDFTGDGQSDLLFRHVSTGEIASWGVANNTLSVPPQVLGSTAPQFRIVAVDDFTGDNQADILFRDETNGEIAIWRVANNGLAGVPAVVGSTSQAYHVVATGDFDGNLSNDILFRNDNGDLAMWLLNSSGQLLGAPQLIGNATLDFHVEGSGDLNGDARSDIILRGANGEIVSWFMNGASFAQPPAVLATANVDHAIAAHHFDVV